MNRPPSAMPRAGLRLPQKSLADTLAIAIGPCLIMLLVGSLNFFLVEVGYRGSFSGQVNWTLFWFTVASVLVSRISIEHGSDYAALYGIALGAATGLRLCQFLGAPLSALLLLGLIWWCASKLTWDCTLIDENQDASGQGLLAVARLEGEAQAAVEDQAPIQVTGTERPAFSTAETPARRPHAPGLWLLYFSLGALPIFGIGQWTLPVTDGVARGRAFVLCFTFVASALTLLLTTSFLGLRRYLRQRRLLMPAAMARSWMTLGGAIIVTVLLGALLLPRPRGPDTLARFAIGLRDRAQTASRFAWMRGEAAPGEGRRIGRSSDATPTSPPRREGSDQGAPAESSSGSKGSDPAGSRDQGNGTGGDGRQTREGEPARTQPTEKGTSSPEASVGLDLPPEGAASLIRWASYALAAGGVGYLLLRFGRLWLDALRKARAAKRLKRPPARPAAKDRRPAFADYADPFVTGKAASMSPAQLVAYTFEALQAWAADAGRARPPEQTPVEFGNVLARTRPDLAEEFLAAIRLYLRVAYGGCNPAAESLEPLRRLWSLL